MANSAKKLAQHHRMSSGFIQCAIYLNEMLFEIRRKKRSDFGNKEPKSLCALTSNNMPMKLVTNSIFTALPNELRIDFFCAFCFPLRRKIACEKWSALKLAKHAMTWQVACDFCSIFFPSRLIRKSQSLNPIRLNSCLDAKAEAMRPH